MKWPCRTFFLLLHKNLLVKSRSWKLIIIVEALIPIALIAMMQALRDFSANPPTSVATATYEPKTEEELSFFISRNLNILYTPYNDYTAQVMDFTQACLKTLSNKTIGFTTEEELLKAYSIGQVTEEYYQALAVIFDQSDSDDNHVFKYNIRHSWTISKSLYDGSLEDFYGPTQYFQMIYFTQLQMCLDRSFITKVQNTTNDMQFKMSIQQMPYPSHVQTDTVDFIMRMVICRILVMVFIIPLCIETQFITKEKSIGINVLAYMNGVKLYQNLLSWLIISVLLSIIYVVPITVLFQNTFSTHVQPYLYYGNAFIFCILLFTHVTHLVTFGIHVSAYFSKPRFVVLALTFLYMGSFALQQYLIAQQSYSPIPFLGIIFPNMLLYRLIEEVDAYESKMIGIQWDNAFKVSNMDYTVFGSIGALFLFSILSILLHFFAALYVNALLPGKYGVSKNPFYFLQRSRKNKVSENQKAGDLTYTQVNGQDFEVVPSGALTPGIEIRNLKKTYKTGWRKESRVEALRGISIDFYKGQITALLGHNGAGKTTLMSILTGMIPETDGNVFINGNNISNDPDVAKYDLALCPQHNVYFPDLNVFEQIRFFGQLKSEKQGKSKKDVERDVDILLGKLKLSDKKNTLPDKLSGGQKRRLCLAMALIGNANILILDEPTSGMDPETRRDTWDVLLKMRGDKTIVLSTHDMEEADILGDRVAIVHTGNLKCYGSNMFLKKQYGQGYVQVSLSTKPGCDPQKILNKFESVRQKVNVNSANIILSVPYTDSLPKILDELESQKNELNITGIDVSLITLEQVFLKVTNREDLPVDKSESADETFHKLKGWLLYQQSTYALFDKKITYTRKNIYNLLTIMLIPLLAAMVTSLFDQQKIHDMSIIPLRLDMYGTPSALYRSTAEVYGKRYESIVKSLNGHAQMILSDANITKELLRIGQNDITHYRNDYITSSEFSLKDNVIFANGLFSGVALHSVPLTVNLLTNTLVKVLGDPTYTIEVSRQQLPITLRDTLMQTPEIEAFMRVLPFAFFLFATLALYVNHPIQETGTIVKQLQRMTGITAVTYWSVMFFWDFCIYLISMFLILAGFYAMDTLMDGKLYTSEEIGILLVILMLFGANAILIGYIFSFVRKSGKVVVTILSLVPVGITLFQYILHIITQTFASKAVHALQKGILRLIPYVSFFHGQVAFYETAVQNARCRRLPDRLIIAACKASDPCCSLQCSGGTCAKSFSYFGDFSADISVEESLVYLALTPFLYYFILIIMEERILQKVFRRKSSTKKPRHESDVMDEEVKAEKHIVALEMRKLNDHCQGRSSKHEINNRPTLMASRNITNNLYLVYELSKSYGKLMAVKEVSFHVKQQECFGLLGVNGAGKSTTFRMLTGEEVPDSGLMYLGNSGILTDRKKYLAEMGYCPQTDALLNSLNAFDHLRLFARLRGIPNEKVDSEVNKWINRLNLHACKSQPSGTYSGGNKRRLNIAMALIGNPRLVLLDEPTTGVDPAARRSLWNVLQNCQATGQALILTSHSMEECEALCNRLVIMVRGELVCIGPSQELKHRFGAGYDIHVKLNPARTDEDVTAIKRAIESTLSCEIRDENLGFIGYHVHSTETWQTMYGTMKGLKSRFPCIEDYSVLSATLEQLFIQFARTAEKSTYDNLPKHSTGQAVHV